MKLLAYWVLLALDRAGHGIPWLAFGRVRYAICQAAWRQSIRVDREDQFL